MTLVRLGTTARFVNGAAFKPSDWEAEGLPIIRIQNLTGTGANFNFTTRRVKPELIVEPGDLLVSWSATLDVYRWSGPRGVLNQHIFKVIPNKIVDTDYLYFALKNALAELESKTHGSTMKHVVRGDFEGTLVALPTMANQKQIVDLLSRAEGIVRLRREAQKKAAEIIPALFIDMFGDPATNLKGWAETTLENIVDEFRYGTSQKSGEYGLPTLRIPNVVSDRLDPTEIKLVSVPDAEANRLRLRNGDFLFVRTNGNPDYVGRSAVYESDVMQQAGFDGKNCLYASYLIRARLKLEAINPQFLQTFLSSSEGRKRLREQARTSAGQYNINTEGLANIRVPLPPIKLQADFGSRCRPVFGLQALQESAISKAESTFQVLLSCAFSSHLATVSLPAVEAAVA